jgi:diguanylate cyclase (GGDEF)-like protein/PAS domain S-box-containing protein
VAKKSILVVEDEGITAMRLRNILEEAGYAVTSVEVTGEDAINRASEDKPDLVLMDISLVGEMDGIEAARQIHSRFSIPVVYVTAHSDENILKRIKTTEPFGYIIKPFNKNELRITVEIALYKHMMEWSLRKSRARFRGLVETTSDWIWEVDENAVYTYTSPKVHDILGYEPEEILGKTPFDLMLPEEAERVSALFGPISASHRPFHDLENTNMHKDGHVVVLETSGVPIFDNDGNFSGYRGIDRDISLRRKAQDALISVLDGIEAIVYVADIKTHELLYMNRYTKNIFGDKEGKICWQVLQTGQLKPCDFCTNDKLLNTEGRPDGVYNWEFRNTVDGHWYDIMDRAIQWVDGRIARLEIARDITARKKSEEELRERMRLAELNADIGVALTEGITLYIMLQGCCEALVRHLDVMFTRIWLFNEAENVLELKASAGLYTRLDGKHSRKPLEGNKIGLIARERMPHLTNKVSGDPLVRDQEWVKREKVVSFAGHPLVVENKLLGVMALFSRNELTDITINALISVADIIAVGIVQKLSEEKIKRAKEEWEQTFDIIPDLIAVIDNEYRIQRINKAFAERLGIERDSLIGELCYNVIHGTDGPPSYCPHSTCVTSGEECVDEVYEERLKGHYILSANPVFNTEGTVTGTVEVARNISDRKEMEQKLEEAAITDELTGLFNRRGFFTLAGQQCKMADRSGKNLALLYMDLDGFKNINDELGHQTGDQALLDIAHVLKNTFRVADIIARIGGDEFAVLLTEPSESNIQEIITNHVQNNLKAHNERGGRNYELLVSIGMSHYNPEQPCSVSDLLSKADELMYENKKYHKLQQHVPPLLREENILRRVYKRFSTGDDCWAELDISQKVKIKNIGLGGACLKTLQPLKTDHLCKIILVPREDEEIALSGVVVWSTRAESELAGDDNLPYEAGLKFTELSDSIKSSLSEYTNDFTS